MKIEARVVFSAGLAAEGGGWRGFTGRAGRRIPAKERYCWCFYRAVIEDDIAHICTNKLGLVALFFLFLLPRLETCMSQISYNS